MPRCRICGSPICKAAYASSGASACSSSDPATSACLVVAPMTTSSPSSLMPDSSEIRAMSISTAGWASRTFIIGSSEWPPGQQLRVLAVLGEQRERVRGGVGDLVVERRRDHAVTPSAGTSVAGEEPESLSAAASTDCTMLW